MADSFWRTKAEAAPRKNIRWPSAANIVTQLAIALVMALAWGGLWWGFVQLTAAEPDQTAARPDAATAPAEAEPSPTPLPPTETPTATPSPSPTAANAAEAADAAPPTDAPPPAAATATPTPSPAPTATPLPAPETAAPIPVDDAAGQVSFAADVFPIIENRCVKCHGGEETEEGLNMTSYAGILAGSWNGSVLEPGDVDNSFMVEQIVSGKMPKNEPHLLPGEIRIISEWIAAGAPDN
ncbi:MAG: hypothetical protein KDJ52_27010 [Anaerolineae bacterium]|nr:hypothetical protein [Anaerolineae bacterium]